MQLPLHSPNFLNCSRCSRLFKNCFIKKRFLKLTMHYNVFWPMILISVGYCSGFHGCGWYRTLWSKASEHNDGGPCSPATQNQSDRLWPGRKGLRSAYGGDPADPILQVTDRISQRILNEWNTSHLRLKFLVNQKSQQNIAYLRNSQWSVGVYFLFMCLCFSCVSKISRDPAGKWVQWSHRRVVSWLHCCQNVDRQCAVPWKWRIWHGKHYTQAIMSWYIWCQHPFATALTLIVPDDQRLICNLYVPEPWGKFSSL